MKHEDDFLINPKMAFNEEQGSAKETDGGWIGSEQTEKRYNGRNFTRDPNLDHAAGDYEPLQEDRFAPHKIPPSPPFDAQSKKQESVEIEEIHAEKN